MKSAQSELNLSQMQRGERGAQARLAAPLLLWSIVLCATAAAQQRITGTVTDKKARQPVAATVKLQSDLFTGERVTIADIEGRFAFVGLSPGRYTVSASAEKFYPEQITLVLGPRATSQISFELNPIAGVNEQITVYAESKLIDESQAATVATINRDQILLLPTARRTQLTDIITPFVASAVGSHDNLVHLRGNELSLNTFVNGVSFFDNPHQLFTP